MDAMREEYLALSARREGLTATGIIRQHQHCIDALARPIRRRLFWGPTWLIGEAPKRSHVAACQSFSRLARVWSQVRLKTPVEFRDLTDHPMPKSYSRWGDVRPRRIDAALGARKLLREAFGLSGAVTSDLFVVLLGSTVREAIGAQHLDLYRWYRLPRSETVLGELFVAAIPHPSPLASKVFDVDRVSRLFWQLQSAPVRRPVAARGASYVHHFDLVSLEE